MKREIHLVSGLPRLNSLLQDYDSANSLGVGFFSAKKAAEPNPGFEVKVTPTFMNDVVLNQISSGGFPVFTEDVIFFGKNFPEVPPSVSELTSLEIPQTKVNRWLLCSLQSLLYSENQIGLHRRFKQKTSLRDCVNQIFEEVFQKVLELRPELIVVFLDTDLICHYLQTAVASGEKNGADEIIREVMGWFLDECLHPKVAIVLPSHARYEEVFHTSRALMKAAPRSADVIFRL